MRRRDILVYALGATAGLAACRSSTPTRAAPPGELFDFGMKLGHALRDAPLPTTTAPVKRVGTLIIGAGVAGLACARRLHEHGIDDFSIVEMSDALGGTARAGASPVTKYPWGAHYITTPLKENTRLIALLDELGALERERDAHGDPVPAEHVACRAPEERVFFRGTFHDGLWLHEGASPDDDAQRVRFEAELVRLARLVDAKGRRAFALPRATCSDDADLLALDRMTFAQWLDERGFTSPRLRWVCDYACRDDYGLTLDATSAWAGLFYFCARRPAHDGAHEDRPVITWPEGNGALVAHLARAAAGKIVTGRAAVRVNAERGDVVIVDERGASETWNAQRVVVAAPRFVASRIIESVMVGASEGGGRNPRPAECSAWVVANLHLKDRPSSRGVPFAWDTVLMESPSLGYVTATHQSGRDVGPTVLTWYLPIVEPADPRAARAKLLSLGQREWAEAALSDLEVAHPGLRELVERVDVCRWGHAMPRPVPGTFSGSALADAARSVGRVHFAHSDLSGVGLFEEAFFHGERAAEEIGAAFTAARPLP